METSAEIKNIAKALKDFQKEAPTVTKDGTNPHFKSKFATLENIIETISAPLAKHGLAFSQFVSGDNLVTILLHESGEWMRAAAALHPDRLTPQGQGSAITYMRRYALSAALGIATEDDDDAEAAEAPKAGKAATKTTAPKAKPFATAKDAVKMQEAQKDRIRTLLGKLNLPHATVKETSDSVFKVTGMLLAPGDYEQIGELLAKELEAKK